MSPDWFKLETFAGCHPTLSTFSVCLHCRVKYRHTDPISSFLLRTSTILIISLSTNTFLILWSIKFQRSVKAVPKCRLQICCFIWPMVGTRKYSVYSYRRLRKPENIHIWENRTSKFLLETSRLIIAVLIQT